MTLNTPTEKMYNTSSKPAFPNEVLGTKFETVSFEKEVSDAKLAIQNEEAANTEFKLGTMVDVNKGYQAPIPHIKEGQPNTYDQGAEPATGGDAAPAAPESAPAPAAPEEDYMAGIRAGLDIAPAVAQSQIDAEKAKADDVITEPNVVNHQAMQDNFNTEFTEEELNQEKVDNLSNIGETPPGEAIRNTDLLDAVGTGDMAAAFKQEMVDYTQGKEGLLTKTLKNIDYALAPFMAPIALTGGMMAHQPNTGTVVGDLLASIEAGGDAANERLFRWFAGEEGGMMPDHFGKVVEKALPAIPEAWRPTAAVALELMVTLPMSLGMATAMRTSLQTIQTLGRIPEHGMFTEAMYQLLDWSPQSKAISASTKKVIDQFEGSGTDEDKIRAVIRQAELADEGDKAAYIAMNEQVSGIRGYGSETTEQAMETVKGLLGDADSPTLRNNRVAKNEYDEAGVLKDLSAVADSNARKYNLSAMDDFGDFTRSIDESFKEAKARAETHFDDTPDVPMPGGGFQSKTYDQIIAETKLANKNIEELYAMDLQDMKRVDAVALMEVTVDSMNQLANYAAIFYDPNVSKVTKDVAKAAFAKQLIAHKMIQAKVTGWGSVQGQNLNIMADPFMEQLISSMSTRVC